MSLNFSFVFLFLVNLFSNYSENYITNKYSVHGIDVSHHQKYINWQNVSTHATFKVSFCFMKATEGSDFKDPRFQTNWKESQKAGITRGAYHFFSASSSPYAQAQNYIRSTRLTPGDLAPVLDFEVSSSTLTPYQVRKNLYRWLSTVEKHYGVKPIIYTNTNIYNKYLKGYFKEFPLWIADYSTSNIHSRVSHPNLKLWQYTEHGRVKGISGYVDVNAFLGKEDEFQHLTIPIVVEKDTTDIVSTL